jgi:hypothetical protein
MTRWLETASMRYRLRTLLIVLAFAPPILAGAWMMASKALAVYRDGRQTIVWEDVGGPGAIDGFQYSIRCFVDDEGTWDCRLVSDDGAEDANSEAP